MLNKSSSSQRLQNKIKKMELKKGYNDQADKVIAYRHRLVKRYLELTKELYKLDRDLLLTMQTEDLEELGKAMVQPTKILEEILEKRHVFAQRMQEKKVTKPKEG
jgi:hypothetical protein